MKDTSHEILPLQEDPESRADSIGALFARVRGAHQLEQRQVAAHLGIDLKVIRALEEDAFQRLGPPVFVRGYLTRYARFLGLPEQEILARYKALGDHEPPPLKATRSIKPQARMTDAGVRWISYLLFFGVITYLGWLGLEQVSSHFESSPASHQASPDAEGNASLALPQQETPFPTQPQPSLTASSGDVPAARFNREQPASAMADKSEEPVRQAIDSAPGIAERPPAATAEVPAPAVENTVPEEAVAAEPVADIPPAGEPQLVMEFADDCWVDIKDADGERLAYGTLKANTVHTFSGPAPFSVVLGNAGAVSISLNGQAIDKATYVPRRGTVARFTLDMPAESG